MNNNNYNHYNDRRDYYQRNQPQDRNQRYQSNPYGSQPQGYNQQYNNSYDGYQINRYDSYPQNYNSYSPRYDSYQPPPQQQQYQYNNNNMYNQPPQQPPQQYQYNQPYNQQYQNMPPGDFGQPQQNQGPPPNDQEYMNSKLIDFRGRLREYIPYASPRRAIVRLYTGKPSDDWLINELIQNMKTFIEYKAGVTFLYNIQSKMTYTSQSLNEAILTNYENILKIPEGYKIFSKVAEDVKPELISNIAKWCFDVYLQYHNNDPDYIELLSVFVQVLYNNPNCYLKMIDLNVYLSNPTASLIGCAILDYCSDEVVSNFINEINNNLSTLINEKNLIELVNSLLIRGPKNIRDLLFNTLYPQLDSFICHPWKWKICSTLMSTLVMSQRFQVADKICRACLNVKEKYMDELICHTLKNVLSSYRSSTLLALVNPIVDNQEFPLVNDFIKNINYAESFT